MLTLEKKEKMIRLYLKGLSYTDIAKEIGMTRQTVSKYIKQYEKDQQELELARPLKKKNRLLSVHLLSLSTIVVNVNVLN